MKAVVFNGPWKIDVEDRPTPVLELPTDAIVRVTLAGVCGSELHMYRGHQETKTGHIMGHEFCGIIEEIGSQVKLLSVGMKVVTTFSVVCGSCWFCQRGYTNRCVHGTAFGTQALAGGQAEFVRVPFADGTLRALSEDVPDDISIMMCDIFPTGYYGAIRALQNFAVSDSRVGELNNGYMESASTQPLTEAVVVCVGCGPVGLCAILTAKAKGVRNVYAVDSVDDRLHLAQRMGAIPLQLGKDNIQEIILQATSGRGADAVVEVVGNKAAMRSAFELLRPCGTLSSIGFHQGELPFTAFEAYQKNLNINMGRAAISEVFDEALEVAVAYKDKLEAMITHRLPLTDAASGYAMFEKQIARKVLLIP